MLSMHKVVISNPDVCFCLACGTKQVKARSAEPCESCLRGQVFTSAQLLSMFMAEEKPIGGTR